MLPEAKQAYKWIPISLRSLNDLMALKTASMSHGKEFFECLKFSRNFFDELEEVAEAASSLVQ